MRCQQSLPVLEESRSIIRLAATGVSSVSTGPTDHFHPDCSSCTADFRKHLHHRCAPGSGIMTGRSSAHLTSQPPPAVDEITALEYSTVKVPYELLNKKFRAAQKSIEQQLYYCKRSQGALAALFDGSKTPVRTGPVRKEFSLVTQRLREYVNGLDNVVSDEKQAAEALHQKASYLTQGYAQEEEVRSIFRKHRINRFIIDHLLRSGYFETAQKMADYVSADNSSKNVFHVAKQVEEALQRHDLSICLNWVTDNRSKLHRLQSDFETEVRVQQLIQKIMAGSKLECVPFLKQYFGHNGQCWKSSTLMSVMGLLAFGPNTEIKTYRKLIGKERWEQILEMFRNENARIFKLSSQSAFSVCLQVGLAAHKTPSCKKDPTSRCIICRDFYDLASGLPYAHETNSRLICPIDGSPLNDTNRPMMISNGRVYGERALGMTMRDNMVVCPSTSNVYSADEVLRIYIL